MMHELRVSDEQLLELDLLLGREWEATRSEHHHTASRDYREMLKGRMDVLKRMRSQVEETQHEPVVG